MYPDGAKDVKLGSPVAILSYDAKDVAAFADYVPGGAPKAAVAAKSEPKSESTT